MWVSIIPIGGVKMTWSDWTTLYNGAKVAQNHQGSILSIPLTNIVASENLADFGRVESLFLVISRNQ